ncbi:hypothetical protein JOC61_001999 [Marinitoga litoralis]|nr:hypothetical protein [Marinitoga litoralis]
MNNDMTKEENFDVVKRNIDLNSYLDYMVAEMFIDNRDWPGNNMKIWKKHKDNLDIVGHDGKWRFMMYDTDNGLYEYDSNMFLHAIEGNPEVWHPNPIWSTEMFKKLLTNKEFRYRFINTYMDHLNNTFDVNNTHKIIERLEHEYEKELIEHFNRWHNNTIEKWESGIEYVEYFLTQRPSYVKKQLEEYFNVDIVKMFLKFRGDGEIYINDRFIYNNNRNIEYVKNIPIKLKAVSNENSKFLYWVVDNNKIYENEINIVPKENLIITPVFENKDNKNLLFIISSLLIGGAIIYILNK